MAKRRLLLMLKSLDIHPYSQLDLLSRTTTPRVLGYLENRRKVHEDAINFCQDVLRKKAVDWQAICRNTLSQDSQPIHNVDLVVTIGGDGTLLQASHFMDDSVPVLGVNSDPTQVQEVEEFSEEFDATRSTGHLCAATIGNFEQVLDDILDDRRTPSNLSRMSICLNSQLLPTYALNDALLAHPCPATVSRCSFKIKREGHPCSPLVHCRSSGLRVSTAAGSTAAMLSAGGFAMPILSQDLQYMVREPISPGAAYSSLMHGLLKPDQSMVASWFSKDGVIYIDGSDVSYSIKYGDTIEMSSKAPVLKVFLPHHLLS